MCLAARVSAMRVGTTLAARLSPVPYHADRSTTRFTAADVNRQTLPAAPTATVARLGTVAPAVKLRFDTSGLAVSHGHAVTKPAPPASVTVNVTTAASTPLAGRPA